MNPEQEAKIAQLIQQLGHTNKSLRRMAKKTLIEIGQPTIPALHTAFDNKNQAVRDNAENILYQLLEREKKPRVQRTKRKGTTTTFASYEEYRSRFPMSVTHFNEPNEKASTPKKKKQSTKPQKKQTIGGKKKKGKKKKVGLKLEYKGRRYYQETFATSTEEYFDVLDHPSTLHGGHWESNRRKH